MGVMSGIADGMADRYTVSSRNLLGRPLRGGETEGGGGRAVWVCKPPEIRLFQSQLGAHRMKRRDDDPVLELGRGLHQMRQRFCSYA